MDSEVETPIEEGQMLLLLEGCQKFDDFLEGGGITPIDVSYCRREFQRLKPYRPSSDAQIHLQIQV